MKKVYIESLKNGKLLSKKQYEIRTTWDDLTLKHFMAYMVIVNRREEYLRMLENGMVEDDQSEQNMEEDIFSVDILAVLTGLPKEIVYTMNRVAILELNSLLEFTPDKLPKEDEFIMDFWFRSATDKKIKIWENDYKSQSYLWSPKKKAKTALELEIMKKSHFTLKAQVDDMEFEKYIASQRVLKEIKQIQKELKNQDFSRYAQLIAYIVDRNGTSLNINEAKKLAVVFEDLPFTTAYKIVNFFLKVRSVLSSNTKQYLNRLMVQMSQKLKPQKKSS